MKNHTRKYIYMANLSKISFQSLATDFAIIEIIMIFSHSSFFFTMYLLHDKYLFVFFLTGITEFHIQISLFMKYND